MTPPVVVDRPRAAPPAVRASEHAAGAGGIAADGRWARGRTWIVRAVVWGTFAALLVQAFGIIATYGRDMPMVEDWLMVRPLVGREPDFVAWLLDQWAEHIVATHKLVYLAVLKLSGGDFRSGMVLNTVALAALSAACVHAASARRGALRATDAFFPLVFLNAGEAPNYAWGWQMQYVLAVLFTCLPLAVMVRHGATPSVRAAVVAAVSIAALPFTGANGLMLALALLPWYALVVARQFVAPRPPGARTRAAIVGAGALVGATCCAIYGARFYMPWWNPPNPGPRPTVVTALEFAAMAVGPGVFEHRRIVPLVLAPVVLGAAVLVARRAWRAFRTRDEERWRVAGLVLFLGGCAGLTAAMGYGRAAMVPQYGIPARYALLAAPTAVAAYYAWDLYGPRRAAHAAQWALLALAVFLLPSNRVHGGYFLEWYRREMDGAIADVRAGMPPEELARRHLFALMRWDEKGLVERIRLLRDARIGAFVHVPPDAPGR